MSDPKGTARPGALLTFFIADAFAVDGPAAGTHTYDGATGFGDASDSTYGWARAIGHIDGDSTFTWLHEWAIAQHPTGRVDYLDITLRHQLVRTYGSASIQPAVAGSAWGTTVPCGTAWQDSSWRFTYAPSGDLWTAAEFNATGIGFYTTGTVADTNLGTAEVRVAEISVTFYGPANTTLTMASGTSEPKMRLTLGTAKVTKPVKHQGASIVMRAPQPVVRSLSRSLYVIAATARHRVQDARVGNARRGWKLLAPTALSIVFDPITTWIGSYTPRTVYEAAIGVLRPAGSLGDQSMTTAGTVTVAGGTTAAGTITVTMPNIGRWDDLETLISGVTPYLAAWRGDYGTATKTYGSAWLGFSVHGTQMLGAVSIPARGTSVPELQASPYIVAGSYFTRAEHGAPWQPIDPISIDNIVVMQAWSGTAGTASLCVHEAWIELRGYSLAGSMQNVYEPATMVLGAFEGADITAPTAESVAVTVGERIEN